MTLKYLRYNFILLFSFFLLFPLLSCGHKEKKGVWPMPEKELRQLNNTLSQNERYAKKSEEKADSIKRILRHNNLSSSKQIEVLMEISAYYRPRMADSSLYYANLAYNLAHDKGSSSDILCSTLALTDALSASGYFSGASMTYDSISIANAELDDKIKYWYSGRQMFSDLCNYIGEGQPLYDTYQEQEIACGDSLIKYLPHDHFFRTFLISQKLVNSGKDIQAREGLSKILGTYHKGTQMYGMAAFQMAQTYRRTDQTLYASYLAMAAESDIMGAIRDGYALPSLSDWLYHEQNYKEAFRFVNFAMNDANKGSARMRLVNISSMIPSIDEAYRKEISSSLSDFALYAVMVSVILIFLIILLALIVREMRKRRHAHTQLASLSKMKDSYIRDFIGLCSAYSEKYDSLAKTVTRKITAGQSQDLLKLLKNGKASENENEEFYQTIDRVFTSLYPDFISQINNLLQPEQRYDIEKNSNTLNPELRIYGFVRLGVSESAKIAKILNYSANTVYAYRNRMRNKAINRDTFDDDVLNMDQEENDDNWGL